MSTYSELVAKIRVDIKVSTTGIADAILEECVKRAIRLYEVERFDFNVKRSTLSILADTEYLDLPVDYLAIHSLALAYSDARYPLYETRMIDIDEDYSEASRGQPTHYAIYGSEIRFYPIPDRNYTAYINYVYQLPELSASDDTNGWTTTGENLITATAKRFIYAEHLFNAEMAQMMNSVEQQCLAQLNKRTFHHHGSKQIKGSF